MNKPANVVKKIRAKARHLLIGHLTYEHQALARELELIKLSIGKHEARSLRTSKIKSIQDAEFRVFSQFGEDGIIQYLIQNVPIKNEVFIELGVGNYAESNTHFLLMNNNWQGKIVNSGTEHINYVRSEQLGDFYYRYDIEPIDAFIDRENINKLITNMHVPEDIGLLSIDLDGVDYWIWEAITTVKPRIVIMEYNSHLGVDVACTVPYKRDFYRMNMHYSGLYFGASISALCLLAKKKGYRFVGSNSAGVNAFFVREDVAKGLPKLTAKQGYVKSRYRESRDKDGRFTFISDHQERLKQIADQKIYDIEKDKVLTIAKAYNLSK